MLVILAAYLLLQLKKITSQTISYSLFNALGSLAILLSLYFQFNLSAFLIEFFWLLISLFGLGRIFLERRSHERHESRQQD